jgi:hypothetical protein
MGDRANFGFKTSTGPTVYLYGHWAGYKMMDKLAHALQRVSVGGRLTDDAYATRICISDIVDDHSGDLGWGITVDSLADNEHSVPVVDWEKGVVTLYDSGLKNEKFQMPIQNFIQKFLKTTLTK